MIPWKLLIVLLTFKTIGSAASQLLRHDADDVTTWQEVRDLETAANFHQQKTVPRRLTLRIKANERLTDTETARTKRDIIEEEVKYDGTNSQKPNDSQNDIKSDVWLPDSDDNVEVHSISDVSTIKYSSLNDRATGREARASDEHWIKLTYPNHDDEEKDQLVPPQPSQDLLSSRMPRVNFVTQNKRLEASESRNERESVAKGNVDRTDDLRTDYEYQGVDNRARNAVANTNTKTESNINKETPYNDRTKRRYYDDPYYDDPYYRNDPYIDYDSRRDYNYRGRLDRVDDDYTPRKSKRIIYYANLPEVVRTPPRYRYPHDPLRRYDDDYYPTRAGRYYDYYRYRRRNPYYGGYRRDDRYYRDLIPAGTVPKDKKIDKKLIQGDENKPDRISKDKLSSDYMTKEPRMSEYLGLYDEVYDNDFKLYYDIPTFRGPIDDPFGERKY